MSLSDAFWLAAAFAVLCAYYIGEKIIDIDFSCFLAKNGIKVIREHAADDRITEWHNDEAVRVARRTVVVRCGFEVKRGNSRKSFYYVGYDLGG